MDKISRYVLRHNKLVILIFLALAVLCALLQFGVSVNYNLVDYLPAGVPSTTALAVIEEEFTGAIPNARVLVEGVTIPQALWYKAQLAAMPDVQDVLWLDDVVDIQAPLAMADNAVVETYYKGSSALFSVSILKSCEMQAVDEIYALIGDKGAISGDAAGKALYQKMSGSETARAMTLVIPVILILLFSTTQSWFEPVLFLSAIGVSILLNIGSNVLFGQISFITKSISPILQLAVSLDYAIFLLHNFEKYRGTTDTIEEAMHLAVKRSFMTITASATTTLFGFLVLVAMRFGIGSDLGIVLGKGIAFSLITVLLFLPALTLFSYKLIDKTKHRSYMPSFSKASKLVVRGRIPILIFVMVLVIPSYLAQNKNTFVYGTGLLDIRTRAGQDEQRINEQFGVALPLVVLVPKGDVVKEKALTGTLCAIPSITTAISYAKTVGTEIPVSFLEDSVVEQFYSRNYARIVLYADIPSEGARAFELVERVRAAAADYYGEEALAVGQCFNLYDMRDVITTDNALVSILAILAIGLIILISFKSIALPVLLVMTIETAIWINLSIPYFTDTAMVYIGFLVINTVQLGATVDYAILFSDHYMDNRKRLLKRDAAICSAQETMGSILISGFILSITGFLLGIVSTNDIVSQMGILLGRGALFSMALVLFFLPAVLTLLDKVIEKTTLRASFISEREGRL